MDALHAMGNLTQDAALRIFWEFANEKLGMEPSSFNVMDRSVTVYWVKRACKVIVLTEEIHRLIHVNVEGNVRYIKLVGYQKGPMVQYQGASPEVDTSLPAITMFCDIDNNVLWQFECDSSNMRSKLESVIKSVSGASNPPNPPPDASPPSTNVVLDMGDVYEIFVDFMQKKLADKSLVFNFNYGDVGARGCRVISLNDDILKNIRIGRLKDIRFIKLCGYEEGGLGVERKLASIHFVNSARVDVWSIEGDKSTLLRKLGELITFEIGGSEPPSSESKPSDPSAEEYTAKLEQIIQICNDLKEKRNKSR